VKKPAPGTERILETEQVPGKEQPPEMKRMSVIPAIPVIPAILAIPAILGIPLQVEPIPETMISGAGQMLEMGPILGTMIPEKMAEAAQIPVERIPARKIDFKAKQDRRGVIEKESAP
jgi:hypothetical protein